ncbi:MAG: hypothetical protein IPM53_24905 [Anaerolineaceae bacterium]|nr:hypothetical protein [Anaerolineaceae bacterium]
MTILRHDDNRGGLAYPFLPSDLQWQIISRSFDVLAAYPEHGEVNSSSGGGDALNQVLQTLDTAVESTLRWVKDDKVLDLHVPGMDTHSFLARTGLRLSMAKGGYVLSKRLSRVMRPFRYWGFFNEDEVTIDYNELLDGRLWDGSGQVSRGFIQRLADSLDLDDRHCRELLHTNRFEVTTLHTGGQDKGHVLVVDDLAVDFMFPANSAKQELALADGRIFIGLNPIHSEDQMCLDIQSIINMYPFFQPEHLLAWSEMESSLFLEGIRSGRLQAVLNRLYDAESVADLDSLADWHVGEYIASGGSLMWFSGMVKAVARQHLKRLGSRASKLRCPAPGGRYYLFPAGVGNRQVSQGQIELDPASATAWVNDTDWLTYLVDVLGGCDGDDAVWVFPFSDQSDAGKQKLLVWRSPNQLGECVVLQPTAASHIIAWDVPGGRQLTYPKMKSCLLPPRIDNCTYQYGELEAGNTHRTYVSYSVAAMSATIAQAAANQGVLGGFCNVAMLCKAVYGRLPDQLPATLEAIIDGSVKTGLDLTPVKEWNQMAISRMVNHGLANPNRAIPQAMLDRLPNWLRDQAAAALINNPRTHWLDTLSAALENHRAQFWADVEALAAEACPPVTLFDHGGSWLHLGKELRQAYSRVMRHAFQTDKLRESESSLGADASFEVARVASEAYLNLWPAEKRPLVLLGAAAYLYAQGPQAGEPVRDALIWQLGARRPGDGSGREPGLAQAMIQALRQIGLLGEPVWTTVGAVLHYADEPNQQAAGVPVRLNGVWLNLLNATAKRPYTRMADVPPVERNQAKARIADYVQERFRGMMLTTEVTNNDRVVTRTPHGNLFGYVQKDHELAAIRHDQWRIAWAHAIDGNVLAVLEPACL